jgi:hypothetical protein
MFIRFVVGHDAEHHRSLTGIVTEARLLRDKGHLDDYAKARLEEAYTWLNANLPVPPFKAGNWPRDAVTWFKDEADAPVAKMWEIATLLKEHGIPVRMLRSKRPGRVLYEDSYQVVVEEWRELRAGWILLLPEIDSTLPLFRAGPCGTLS